MNEKYTGWRQDTWLPTIHGISRIPRNMSNIDETISSSYTFLFITQNKIFDTIKNVLSSNRKKFNDWNT